MINKTIFLFLTSLCILNGFSQSEDCNLDCQKRRFTQFADSLGLVLRVPAGFQATPVHSNKDLNYRFAIINADSSLEVRYTVYPLKEQIKGYEAQLAKNPKLKEQMIHPNDMHPMLAKTAMQKLGGGRDWKIVEFDSVSVREEFGAESGGTCYLTLQSPFGAGYTYAQFVYLHQDNVADVIVTFLCNDRQRMSELMRAPFMSLVFDRAKK